MEGFLTWRKLDLIVNQWFNRLVLWPFLGIARILGRGKQGKSQEEEEKEEEEERKKGGPEEYVERIPLRAG
jgi:hypothetical protein